MPAEFLFLVYRPSSRHCVMRSDRAEPLAELEALVDDELYDEPGRPGRWATLDRQTTVERWAWVGLGVFPEDHAGSGVPVTGAVAA
jgi:hypothetical protein